MRIKGKVLAAAAAMLAMATMVAPLQAAPNGRPGLCRPKAAQALAGKRAIGDRTARRMTGASTVRQIRPGDPVTMDMRRERVTIETDPATRRIVRAYCG